MGAMLGDKNRAFSSAGNWTLLSCKWHDNFFFIVLSPQHGRLSRGYKPRIRRHIGFVRDYNSHNARSSRESIWRHCTLVLLDRKSVLSRARVWQLVRSQFFHLNLSFVRGIFVPAVLLTLCSFPKMGRKFLKFFEICPMLRFMLRHIMVYTLIDHSSRPMSGREILQLWYKKLCSVAV